MADRVDILLAAYNGSPFLAEQIASIRAQTYRNWRLLISDDGSSDGTLDVARTAGGDDTRIRVFPQHKPFGSARAHFMHLLTLSDAPYVMLCDQDDVWLPHKIEAMLDCMRKTESQDPEVPVLVFCDLEVVDGKLRRISPSFWSFTGLDSKRTAVSDLLVRNPVTGCASMMNAALVKLARATPAKSYMVMHDWWLALLAASFGKLVGIDDQLVQYRQHGANEAGAVEDRLLSKLGNLAFSRRLAVSSVRQAVSFLEIYGNDMPNDAREVVSAYARLPQCGVLRRISVACKYGFWKRGLPSALFQAAVLLRLKANMKTCVSV